jgi:hypothetical protein
MKSTKSATEFVMHTFISIMRTSSGKYALGAPRSASNGKQVHLVMNHLYERQERRHHECDQAIELSCNIRTSSGNYSLGAPRRASWAEQ